MLLKRSNTIKASSLIETVMAITLISICSLIALTVYLNVITQNKPVYYYEAKHTIEKLAQQAEQEQDFTDDSYRYTNYTIEKTRKIDTEGLVAIIDYSIQIGQKVYTIKKLIPIETEN